MQAGLFPVPKEVIEGCHLFLIWDLDKATEGSCSVAPRFHGDLFIVNTAG